MERGGWGYNVRFSPVVSGWICAPLGNGRLCKVDGYKWGKRAGKIKLCDFCGPAWLEIVFFLGCGHRLVLLIVRGDIFWLYMGLGGAGWRDAWGGGVGWNEMNGMISRMGASVRHGLRCVLKR